MDNLHHNTNLHATTAVGACWWALDALYRHGPSWQLVPPILIGLAGLIGALRGYLNDAQARRHSEDLHRASLASFRPKVEMVDPGRH